jgi:class 3 adenylate cyclase
MRFLDTVANAKNYLRDHGRVSLRALKREFDLDEAGLQELVEELVDVQQVAAREGKVLTWVGSAPAEISATGPEAHSAAVAPPPPRTVPTTTPSPASDCALPEGERRHLTVMFCDLVGSTPLGQRFDAEELHEVVRAFQESCAKAVDRFEGHIATYMGDGMLVYFGYPQAHEDDPERAIRAGLGILEAMEGLNARLERDHGTRISTRIGIHSGPVVVGGIGGAEQNEKQILGHTMNLAARLEGIAETDSVAISADTLRLVAGLFITKDLGARELKGVAEAVPVHRVLRRTGVRSRLALAAGRLTTFVGREAELATLVDRWERAQEGEGQNVLVLGEAGVGKSRLAYQFRERLAAVPHTWLECGATPYTEGTPFHPAIALVSQGLGLAPDDTDAEKIGKLERGLRALASAEGVSLLADFVGVPPPTPLAMGPDLQRRKTMELLTQWCRAMSEAQPIVILVEDLHWCDASSLELLERMVVQSATARMLFIATARPEFKPPWPARENMTPLQLARLTKKQAREMATALGGADLPAETLEALVARAGGVPLYVEELTKSMADPGAAQGVDAIPATLADSLMARLDRLSTAKEVAQRAAVLGREFSYPRPRPCTPSSTRWCRRRLTNRSSGARASSSTGAWST